MNDSAWELSREKSKLCHAEYVQKRAHDAVEIIDGARRGEIGFLLAAIKINSILHELPEFERRVREDDFLFLTGVASECDGLPLGSERQYWAPVSLEEKDIHADAYERAVHADLLTTFARIADDLRDPF
jgi:hypothetical protein